MRAAAIEECEQQKMAPVSPEGDEGDGTKPQDFGSPHCSAQGSDAAQEGRSGARGGWNSSRSVNGSECSWQVMAARRSIENSLSVLGVRSWLSAGDVAAPGNAPVEWDGGGGPAAAARRLSAAEELLAVEEQKKNNQLILFVFCIIFLLEIFVNFDSGVIPAILVTLQKSFGIDGAAAGLLGSLPYIGLVASSPFVGRGLTTFSPKWFCFITMVVNLFATGLLGLAVQKWMLFLSRLLIGLSQAGFSIYAPVWVDQFAPADKLTLWMGLAQGGVVLGTMLGCILAGSFDSAAGADGENSGWRYALLIQAIGLFLLLFAWLLLPRRFVDINMHQAKTASETFDTAAEASATGEVAPGRKEKAEEEQATGVEGTAESPQKAEATTTANGFHRNSYPGAANQTPVQEAEHHPLQSSSPDAPVVSNSSSEAPPQKDGELIAARPVNTANEAEVAAAVAGVSNGLQATTTAPASDKRSSGRRYSAAGLGKTILDRLREDAAASNNRETEEGRRWSAIAGIGPGGLFTKKSEKRPATAAGGLVVAGGAAEASATRDNRSCLKALSDGGEPGNISNKSKRPSKVTRIVVHPARGLLQSTETPLGSEGLPQFRKNFVSNLLPLDFIATSPTFARRSSQLHPGPAPGAAAAAAAGLASNGPSSCSASSSASSSSIDSSRKELLRSVGAGGGGTRGVDSATGLGAHSRSYSSMLTGGARPGTAATLQSKRLQLRKKGSSTEQLRLQGGTGFRATEEMPMFPAGEAGLRHGPASVEFLPSPTEDASSDSATAAPPQQQQQQWGQFLLGFVSRPATTGGGVAVEKMQRRTHSAATITPGGQTTTSHSTVVGGAVAAPSSESRSGGAAQDVMPHAAASDGSSNPSLPRNGSAEIPGWKVGGVATKWTGGAEDSGKDGSAVRNGRSSGVTVASSGEGATAASRDTRGPPGTEEHGRRRSDSSYCSMSVNGERRQHEEGARVHEAENASADNRVVVRTAAATMPAIPTTNVGAAGAGPPGGMNEVQYQRIFMTPHASTLAFEAFNWAAGVADPLLLVRDNGRHYSAGGLPSCNVSGTSLGVGGVAALSPGDAAGAPLHVGRRRRSTTGMGSITKGSGRTSIATITAPVIKTEMRAEQSAGAPTTAGEDSLLTAGPGTVQDTRSGPEAFTLKQNALPKRVNEGDLPDNTRLGGATTIMHQPGGGAMMLQGRPADQHTGSADVETSVTRARHNVEMTAISEQGSEHLMEKTSVASTDRSIGTISQEPRTFGVWKSITILFSSPVYICVTIALCALFFEVTAIQFWSITYFQEELQVPKGQVLVAFNVTAATGPILGVLAGGWFIDFVGGYKTEKGMMKTLLILGLWATICLLLGTFACWVPNFVATIAFVWGILFFGGGILPAATGIVIASVPLEVRAFGSGFCMMIYNVFGYVLGTALPGAIVQAAGLAWGMRVVFLWSIFGVGGLYAAAFIVWRLRIRPSYYVCTYGVEKQEDVHSVRSNEGMRRPHNSLRYRESSTATARGVGRPEGSADLGGQPAARRGISQ